VTQGRRTSPLSDDELEADTYSFKTLVQAPARNSYFVTIGFQYLPGSSDVVAR